MSSLSYTYKLVHIPWQILLINFNDLNFRSFIHLQRVSGICEPVDFMQSIANFINVSFSITMTHLIVVDAQVMIKWLRLDVLIDDPTDSRSIVLTYNYTTSFVSYFISIYDSSTVIHYSFTDCNVIISRLFVSVLASCMFDLIGTDPFFTISPIITES